MKRLDEFTEGEKLSILGGTEAGTMPADTEFFDCWFGGCKEGCKDGCKQSGKSASTPGHIEHD